MARLIRQVHEVDPLLCPRCGEAMRILAFVEEPEVAGSGSPNPACPEIAGGAEIVRLGEPGRLEFDDGGYLAD